MTGVLPGVRGIAHNALSLKPPFKPPGRSLPLDRAEARATWALSAFELNPNIRRCRMLKVC